MVDVATWLDWEFGVYEHDDPNWRATPGLYVFAAPGLGYPETRSWHPVYVGQTSNFASRIPTHENWPEAVAWGATHVHARVEHREDIRAEMERRLVQELQPPLNVQLR